MTRKLKALFLSLAVLAAVVLQATPVRAAFGPPITLSLQVIGYTSTGVQLTLGRVDGVVQYDGRNAVSYTLTFCRQSSYQLPYMTINVNSQARSTSR